MKRTPLRRYKRVNPRRRRKPDLHRFEGLPLAPAMRTVDPAALAAQRSTACEVCDATGRPIHRHHIRSRGAGGSDRRENTIDCCHDCHDRIHRALIPRDCLLAIVAARNH